MTRICPSSTFSPRRHVQGVTGAFGPRGFLAFLWLFFPLLGLARSDELVLSLVAPTSSAVSASEWEIGLLVYNPSSSTVHFQVPGSLRGEAIRGEQVTSIEFLPDQKGKMFVPAGGFSIRRYLAKVSPGTVGLVVLQFSDGLPYVLRTVLSVEGTISNTGAIAATSDSAPVRRRIDVVTPASTAIERSFAGRIGMHEPVYFIYGPDAPAAKFQLSFKYQLLNFDKDSSTSHLRTLQGAYTQRSLWDIQAASSPFYDTSYMPELMYEDVAPMPKNQDRWVSWLGYQTGFKHESNGRDGLVSRSLNTVYVRPALLLGPLDRWHLLVIPEFFVYVTPLDDNPTLKDYRGYGQMRVALTRGNHYAALMYTGRMGKDFNHFTHQLDLTLPFKTQLLDVETFLLFQYFNGYGESLLHYDERSDALRAGISLVR